MSEEGAAASAWDWSEQRVTVGRHFIRDMEGLWSGVLKLATVVEESLDQSIHALCDGRPDRAGPIARKQPTVEHWEVALERQCVRVLALHQPVASDLRRVAAVLKINGDLERLSDLARHIAKRVKKLGADPMAFPIPQTLENLAFEALGQVHDSLDALTRADVERARAVIAGDQGIDRHYRAVLNQLKQDIVRAPERINTWLRLINTARNLERVADHASKIAESVIYLRQGEIPAARAGHGSGREQGGDVPQPRGVSG